MLYDRRKPTVMLDGDGLTTGNSSVGVLIKADGELQK